MSDNMTGADVLKLVNTLRENGLDVSNLYLPLHWLSPVKTYTNGCPVAEHACIRIINIRVDETTTWEHANLAGHLVEELTW
jgi:dTDP-4-amino-4,6-dideoxygalactose transaminase